MKRTCLVQSRIRRLVELILSPDYAILGKFSSTKIKFYRTAEGCRSRLSWSVNATINEQFRVFSTKGVIDRCICVSPTFPLPRKIANWQQKI